MEKLDSMVPAHYMRADSLRNLSKNKVATSLIEKLHVLIKEAASKGEFGIYYYTFDDIQQPTIEVIFGDILGYKIECSKSMDGTKFKWCVSIKW